MPDPNSIRIKRSNTSTNVPASLLNGELAANSSDQKLWIGNSSNTPILLSDITNTFVNQGAWDYNATYNKNTVVTYAGIFYYSVSAVPPFNTQPNVNATYWSVLSDPAAVGGTYLPLAGGAMTGSITNIGATHDTEVAGEFFGVQLSADHTQGTMVNFDGLDTYNGASHMKVIPTGLTFPDATVQTTAYTGGAGVSSVTAGTGISVDKTTGDITVSSSITQYADLNARASLSSTATGLTYTPLTGVFSLTSGYSIPATTSQTNWDSGYTQRLQWDGSATNLVAATGRTSLGATTVGGNLLTLVNPSAITFPQFNANNTVTALSAASFRTAIGAGTSSTTGTVTSVALSVPTGLSVTGSPITSTGTLAIALTAGYAIPTTASQTTWDTSYSNRISSLTTTGSSGAATLTTNTLNVPTYTLAGLGGINLTNLSSTATGITYNNTTGVFSTTAGYAIPTTTSQNNWDTAYTQKGQWTGGSTNLVAATGRTSLGLIIGTNVQAWDADLDAIGAIAGTTGILKKTAANTWSLDTTAYTANTGTVTSVAAVTLGTTGTDLTSTIATGTTTPVITLNVPTASSLNRGALSSADWTNFNSGYTQRLQWDGGATNLVAATGRTSLGATTIGSNMLTLVNPTAITFPRFNADNTVSTLDAATYRTAIGAGTSSTTGTVTSVAALTLGTTGTDITSTVATGSVTPVITLNVPTASATNRGALSSSDFSNFSTAYTNRITSLTTTGSSGASTLSANVLNIPNHTLAGLGGQPLATNLTSLSGLSYVSASFVKMSAAGTFALDTSTYLTGNQTVTLSGDVSGSGTTAITTTLATVSIAKGGTGQVTANAAVNALLPSQTSNSGKYLTSNGTDSSWGAVVGGPAFTVSATAPVSPASGDRWYDTNTGSYLIYLNDGTSSQWVETSNSGMVSNPTGTIIPFAGANAPSGFLLCNGATVSSSDYLALHSVISNTYGGSAYSGAAALNFTLPDYRGRVLIGAGTGSGLTARTLGGTVGAESHTVSSSNISQFSTGNAGSHTHTFSKEVLTYLGSGGNRYDPYPGSVWAGHIAAGLTLDTKPDHTHTVGSASPTAISNLQPSIGVNYLIKT